MPGPVPPNTSKKPLKKGSIGTQIGLALVLAAATIALYAPTAKFDFVNYDDPNYVSDNPAVQGGLSVENIRYAFTETGMSDWYPTLYLSYMTDVTLFGPGDAGANHLVNTALHVINVLLLFFLLSRWTGSCWPIAFVAGLFALHPLHVESVAWIAMRKDGLGTLFALLAMAAYSRYAHERDAGGRPWLAYLLVTLCFAAGCMSKANIIMLPLGFLVLDLWPLNRLASDNAKMSRRRRTFLLFLEKTPWFAISLAIAALHLKLTGTSVDERPDLTLIESAAIALVSYAGYLYAMLWPVDLACWYPHPAEVDPAFLGDRAFLMRLVVATLLLTGITILSFWQAKRRPYLVTGWLWYVMTLLPSSGLVSFASFYLADRYAYLPIWGIYWMAAWGGAELLTRRTALAWPARVGAVAAMIACFILSWQQVQTWRDSESLMRQAISVTDNNAFANNNLGIALLDQERWEEALTHFNTAREIKPDYITAHNNAGVVYQQLGQIDDAIAAIEQALAIDPIDTTSLYHLGNAYLASGAYEKAIERYKAVTKLDPSNAEAHNNWGNALQLSGRVEQSLNRYDDAMLIRPGYAEAGYNRANALVALQRYELAVAQYRETLEREPDYAEAHNNLGGVLRVLGKQEQALDHYEQALEINPDYASAHANRADTLIALAQPGEAIESYKQALRLTPDDVGLLVNLSNAYALRGEFDQAATQIESAIRIASEAEKATLEKRLEAYKSRRRLP